MGRRRTGKASSTGETTVSPLTPNPEFESFATVEEAKALLDFPRPSEFPLRGSLLFQVTTAAWLHSSSRPNPWQIRATN
jgi:hypothetical protein